MDSVKPKLNYWVIAALGLVWNLMGCLNFVSQMNPEVVAEFPEAYQALIAARPAWATAAFGIAVFGGAVGCILLILRRQVAVQVLIFSLLGVALTLLDAILTVGLNTQVLISTGMSLVVALLLVWMARLAARSNWLR